MAFLQDLTYHRPRTVPAHRWPLLAVPPHWLGGPGLQLSVLSFPWGEKGEGKKGNGCTQGSPGRPPSQIQSRWPTGDFSAADGPMNRERENLLVAGEASL